MDARAVMSTRAAMALGFSGRARRAASEADGSEVFVNTDRKFALFRSRSCTRTARSAATCPRVTAASASTASTRPVAVWLVVSTITES